MIGETVDQRYLIEAVIGRGGMGVVYRAQDLQENHPVALKFLHAYMDMGSEATLTRFQREFRVLAQLDHARIVRAYGSGKYNDVPYLILEFLAGRTLAEELHDKPLPRSKSLYLAQQITEALVYLHRQGLVHRDLKPGNLMLITPEDDPQIKLMDFGLVRISNLSQQLTQEGTALGTVAYMSPEQAQALPIDFRADLYALGIILYEMVTGRVPFKHQNPAVMLMQQMTNPVPPPRQFNSQIDKPLEDFILQLLAKEPSERPHSTEEVKSQLRQLAETPSQVNKVRQISEIYAQSPAQRVDLIPRIPLIGRAAVLNELGQAWAKSTEQHSQVVIVAGVAGVGKSRLINEAALPIRMSGGKVIQAQCREHATLPYQPFIDLLATAPPVARQQFPPELARLLPDAPPSSGEIHLTDPTEAKRRLFMASWQCFHQVGQTRPLMIIIEDVQWADPSTLELLDYLAHQIKTAPVQIWLSYRPEELHPHSPLVKMLTEWERQASATMIKLPLLTRDQVGDFLRAALGQSYISNWLIDSFHQATEGNPLFIEETLKALAAEGKVDEWMKQATSQALSLPTLALQLPQNVLALAERRLQLLSENDRMTLTAAAVIGPEFAFNVLQEVAQVDEETLLDAIDRLLASRLIAELPMKGREDRYRFSQEALRQALLQTVSQRRLRLHHRRAGEAMLKLYPTQHPRFWPILAHHFDEAGDAPRALKYHQDAGDAAAKVYANPEAIGHYQRAFALAKSEAAEVLVQTLGVKLGRRLELNNQATEARQVYQDMVTLAQNQGNKSLELAALLAQTTLYVTPTPMYNPAQGQVMGEQALALACQLADRPAEAKALWNLQLAAINQDKIREAIAYSEQSVKIARELGLKEQLAFTLNDIYGAYRALGQVEQTATTLNEARQLWQELDNKPMLIDNLSTYNIEAYLRGDYAKCLALCAEIRQLSEATGNQHGEVYGRWLLGFIYADYGEIEPAIEVMHEVIRLSMEYNYMPGQISTPIMLGWVHGAMGDFAQGIEWLQEVLQRIKSIDTPFWADPLPMLTRLYLRQGNLTLAESTLQECYTHTNLAEPSSFSALWIGLAATEFYLAQQNYTQAIQTADEAINKFNSLHIRPCVAETLYLKGVAQMHLRQFTAAEVSLTAAYELATTMQLRFILWAIADSLSQVKTELGQAEAATALQQQAHELIDFIIAHSPPHLGELFAQLPQVQDVMKNIN